MTIDCTVHGGPDSGPEITWDFSSNANAVPMPIELQASLLNVDRRHYPDPSYGLVRTGLARSQRVSPERIVPTAGSSEGIRRLTLAAFLSGVRHVWVPRPGYGDYQAAAQSLGMTVQGFAAWPDIDVDALLKDLRRGPLLLWLCEPCNPTGHSLPDAFWAQLRSWLVQYPHFVVALDRAYEPLRLHGLNPVPDDVAALCWQLHSPNKALGLTGVRAGWMQMPQSERASSFGQTVHHLAPAWVLSAEGVNVLMHWPDTDLQSWLAEARATLRAWRQAQEDSLARRGWWHQPSCTPYTLSHHPEIDAQALSTMHVFLRNRGIKCRDAASMGRPGCMRWRAQGPMAQRALMDALDAWSNTSSWTARSAA